MSLRYLKNHTKDSTEPFYKARRTVVGTDPAKTRAAQSSKDPWHHHLTKDREYPDAPPTKPHEYFPPSALHAFKQFSDNLANIYDDIELTTGETRFKVDQETRKINQALSQHVPEQARGSKKHADYVADLWERGSHRHNFLKYPGTATPHHPHGITHLLMSADHDRMANLIRESSMETETDLKPIEETETDLKPIEETETDLKPIEG